MGLSGIRAVHVPHVVCPKFLHQVWLLRVALMWASGLPLLHTEKRLLVQMFRSGTVD